MSYFFLREQSFSTIYRSGPISSKPHDECHFFQKIHFDHLFKVGSPPLHLLAFSQHITLVIISICSFTCLLSASHNNNLHEGKPFLSFQRKPLCLFIYDSREKNGGGGQRRNINMRETQVSCLKPETEPTTWACAQLGIESATQQFMGQCSKPTESHQQQQGIPFLCLHVFNKYLLSTYNVLSAVPDTGRQV